MKPQPIQLTRKEFKGLMYSFSFDAVRIALDPNATPNAQKRLYLNLERELIKSGLVLKKP